MEKNKIDPSDLNNIQNIQKFIDSLINLILLNKNFEIVDRDVLVNVGKCITKIEEVSQRIFGSIKLKKEFYKYNIITLVGFFSEFYTILLHKQIDRLDFLEKIRSIISTYLYQILGLMPIIENEGIMNSIMNILDSGIDLKEETRNDLLRIYSEIEE